MKIFFSKDFAKIKKSLPLAKNHVLLYNKNRITSNKKYHYLLQQKISLPPPTKKNSFSTKITMPLYTIKTELFSQRKITITLYTIKTELFSPRKITITLYTIKTELFNPRKINIPLY